MWVRCGPYVEADGHLLDGALHVGVRNVGNPGRVTRYLLGTGARTLYVRRRANLNAQATDQSTTWGAAITGSRKRCADITSRQSSLRLLAQDRFNSAYVLRVINGGLRSLTCADMNPDLHPVVERPHLFQTQRLFSLRLG